MNVQPITSIKNDYYKSLQRKTQTNPVFKANVRIDNKLYSKFDSSVVKDALAKFKKMVKEETLFPSDMIDVKEASYAIKVKFNNIKIKPIERHGVHDPSSESYCPSRTFTPPVVHYTYYDDTASANMELTINNRITTGFYYDPRRTANELADDFFNTYKHLRYLEHYSSYNQGVYEGSRENTYEKIYADFNRIGKPVKEVIYKKGDGSETLERIMKYKYDEKTGELLEAKEGSLWGD